MYRFCINLLMYLTCALACAAQAAGGTIRALLLSDAIVHEIKTLPADSVRAAVRALRKP